jgi:hypothetical protein
MTMVHRGSNWFPAIVVGFAFTTSAVGAGPLSPYKALDLPKAVHPTLHTAPVQAITAGPLGIQLEVTPLDAVKKQFGGVVRGAGDAGDAVTWLCYAGKNAEQQPVVYWFASNDEMSGNHHEVTQVAVQANPSGKAPAGCGEAPSALTEINFGVPSVGSALDAVVKHFGTGKPDAKGYLSYASDVAVKEPKDFTVTQSVQYRVRDGVVTTISVSQVTVN